MNLTTPGFDHNPSDTLEALYRRVHREEMAELAICNPAVEVEALEFKRWEGHWVGAVVTPWFINLLIIRHSDEDWPELKLGKGNELAISFPAGTINFTPRFEPELGVYLCCSLVSPMIDYKTHGQARQAALDAIRQLTAIPLLNTTDETIQSSNAASAQASIVQQQEPEPEALSRRGFLTGESLQPPKTPKQPEQVPLRNAREGLDTVTAALKL